MDIDYNEIAGRLAASFTGGSRLVFWEDDASEHAAALPDMHVDGAEVINVTGHELASKRIVLRERKHDRFVLYRAGGVPRPEDDLLLDLKLAACPFVCSTEGVWADECGIPATLSDVVSDHAAFFRNKKRRSDLAASPLPKDKADTLRFAMTAALFRSQDAQPRDAARSMAKRALVEWASGDEASIRLLNDAGLAQTFWAAMRAHLGYEAPEGEAPGVGDMAFRMLKGRFGSAIPDDGAADEAESIRVLNELAGNGKTREVFERIVGEFGNAVAALVPQDSRTLDVLEGIDAVPAVDEWILLRLAEDALHSDASARRASRIWATRRYGLFADRFEPYYRFVIALGEFGQQFRAYKKECADGVDLHQVLERYCLSWHLVDRRYREAFLSYGRMPQGAFKHGMEDAVKEVQASYDLFLMDLTDRWQLHLLDEGTWPPASLPSQDGFFFERVEKELPRAERGKRIGVVISDALRYEAGCDLATRLSASRDKALMGKTSVSCEHMVGMIPSYTQLGMAALLPDGPMEIDPATTAVSKGGLPTAGTANRGKVLGSRVPGAMPLKAADVLEGSKLSLGDAPVAVVYHNVIDKVGDESETEGKVFEAVETACEEIERLVKALVQAGCGKVLVTSDHGFLFQMQEPEAYAYVDVPGLSQLKSDDSISCDHTRRFIVGKTVPEGDSLIVYTAATLSLEGDYKVGLPKGVSRLRLSGSGARFVHGGASLQENVIPVITVKVSKGAPGSHPTSVEGFTTGRAVITGSSVSVIVYQSEPCGEFVAPQTVKVGVYAADGSLVSSQEKLVELASESDNVEERKTRVSLSLIDEVDAHASVFARISTRIGSTNEYTVAWEHEYAVNRAFGNDF